MILGREKRQIECVDAKCVFSDNCEKKPTAVPCIAQYEIFSRDIARCLPKPYINFAMYQQYNNTLRILSILNYQTEDNMQPKVTNQGTKPVFNASIEKT